MTQQTLLFDQPAAEATASPPKSRFERFLEFYATNPAVYDLFKRFTLEAQRSGKQVGSRVVWERMRWLAEVETSGKSFKLNNTFTPYYARLLMLRHPELDGYFETRDKRFDVDNETLLRRANEIDGSTRWSR